MFKLKKMLVSGMLLAICTGIFAGCNGKSGSDNTGKSNTGEQVTIKFVHKFPEEIRMKFFKEIIQNFEKENSNIKVDMTAYGDEEIKDKTRVILGSTEAPDIFFTWSGERIQQYVDTGNALDLTKYLDEDTEWRNSFNPVMLEASKKQDSYWSIPWDYSCKVMIYNKKVFSDAGIKDVPTTWSELLDTCKKIKAIGKTPIAMGNQYSWVICHYITSLNGKLVPADVLNKNYNLENPNFSDKGYAKALDMVKELYDEGYFNKDANSTTWEMSQTMVQEGTAGMVYEEVQNLKNYNTALGEDGWGYFYLPEIENGAGEKGYITGGPDEFMINSESKHPDEAIKFLKYLTSDEVQAKMCYDLSFFPVTNVKLDGSKMVPGSEEIIAHNLKAPGMSEWLDCVLNQTVADTYLEGCQTIFQDDTGESIMKKVSATATEVKADK